MVGTLLKVKMQEDQARKEIKKASVAPKQKEEKNPQKEEKNPQKAGKKSGLLTIKIEPRK